MSFVERAYEVIHTSGGRLTPQRQLVIDLLSRAAERLDAETLYQLARQQDHSINLATVYRTLNTLEAAGLIREQYISPEHERKYYTLSTEAYHFTCRKCHRVTTFSSDVLEALRDQLKTTLNVTAFNVCICVDGLCADCQKQASEENS